VRVRRQPEARYLDEELDAGSDVKIAAPIHMPRRVTPYVRATLGGASCHQVPNIKTEIPMQKIKHSWEIVV
jgi:hypothetical protein